MGPVIGIGLYGRLFGVGGEGVVSPVGPQLRLGGIGETGSLYTCLCEVGFLLLWLV